MGSAKLVGVGQSTKRVSARRGQKRLVQNTSWRFRLALIIATLVCLAPFVGKAFNIDDPLFVWEGKQIVSHPLNPYGFSVVWYNHETPISEVSKNPPLASYYAALVGAWTNWSETALHLTFLMPAVVVILATYELARNFSDRPALAAVLALSAPVFLTSATSVMSDVPMLAVWMLSLLAWYKGMSSDRHSYLVLSSLLITLCALTKYFGACLLPLLFAYSLIKQRRLGYWILYLLIPIASLIGYQLWTGSLYGQGLLLDAAQYAQQVRSENSTRLVAFLTGLSFTGGCMLAGLLMAPLMFRWRWIGGAMVLAVPGAIAIAWLGLDPPPDRNWLAVELAPFIAGGIIVIGVAVADLWHHRDAESMLLSLWVLGTFVFTVFLNWTVNARSVLPLIPAAAILICRRISHFKRGPPVASWMIAVPVVLCMVVSFALALADSALANSARRAAQLAYQRASSRGNRIFFTGHWGFQYYMQALGARPLDALKNDFTTDDVLVQPENNSNLPEFSPEAIASAEPIEIELNSWVTTQRREMGAGFFSANISGPLPYAFGRVPPERYWIVQFRPMPTPP